MKEMVIDSIQILCPILITIGIWAIAIELEKIRKGEQQSGRGIGRRTEQLNGVDKPQYS